MTGHKLLKTGKESWIGDYALYLMLTPDAGYLSIRRDGAHPLLAFDVGADNERVRCMRAYPG